LGKRQGLTPANSISLGGGNNQMAEIGERVEKLLAEYPVWHRWTLANFFDQVAEKYADRPYILTEDREYSYGETRRIADTLARGYLQMGIRPRDHVALLMGNLPEFVFNLLALLKIGAVTVTINTMLREKELEFILRDSDAVLLVANDKLGKNDYTKILGTFLHSADFGEDPDKGGYEGFPYLKNIVIFSPEGKEYPNTSTMNQVLEWGKKSDDSERARIQKQTAFPDESCMIMYTSGTTAIPKGAVLTHDQLLRGSYASALARGYQDGRRIYFPLPLYHIFAIEQAFAAVLFVGGCMITHAQFTPQQALALIQKHRAYELLGVPSIMMALLNCPERKQYDISSLKAAMISAAPAPIPLWNRAAEELVLTETCTGYGMTEIAGAGTIAKPGDSPQNLSTRVGREMFGGSAGMEEFGGKVIQYKTVDPITGKDLPPGMEGEFACRGPIVIRGYYKRPQENADLIDKDGWLRTGDLGIIHSDGQFQLTGRSKEVYRTFGENVMPKEVEEHISKYPKVNQAYVVGVNDNIHGGIGVAFIEPKPGETINREEIIKHCRNGLAKFKVPRYVFSVKVEELPFTATGKVQKFKLVAMAEERIKSMARSNNVQSQ
jgi:fatty-acyl-CoA synthase